jgi:hypothetical protein
MILIWNKTKKPLAIALSGVGRGLRRRDKGGDVTNVQYKSSWKCHYEFPHNKYILIKILKKDLVAACYNSTSVYKGFYNPIFPFFLCTFFSGKCICTQSKTNISACVSVPFGLLPLLIIHISHHPCEELSSNLAFLCRVPLRPFRGLQIQDSVMSRVMWSWFPHMTVRPSNEEAYLVWWMNVSLKMFIFVMYFLWKVK